MKDTILEIDQLIEIADATGKTLSHPDLLGRKLPPPAQELRTLTSRLEHQRRHSSLRFTVFLLGEFNAGKSTLINAMLGLTRSDGLSVNSMPETAKPTRLTLRQPDSPAAKLVLFDGTEEPCSSWSEARAVTTVAGARDDIREVREVVFYCDHPLLAFADFLDMPGTGAAFHLDHQDITREYLASAELVVWVIGSEEPSGVSLADFREVSRVDTEVAVVFNAWGYLDDSRNREWQEGGFCQEDIEGSVRENFSEAFRHHSDGFRVYAGKCLEAIESGIPPEKWSPDWGMAAWLQWLAGQLPGKMQEAADRRRRNVEAQVRRIAAEAECDCTAWLQGWETAIDDLAGEQSQNVRRRRSASNLEIEIKQKIRELARDRARRILEKIQSLLESFIDDKIRLGNVLANLNDEAKARLKEELERDYLKLRESPSWLDEEFREYLNDCEYVLRSEWQHFLEEISVSMPGGRGAGVKLDFSQYEQALGNAIEVLVTSLLQKVGMIGAVAVAIAFIPGAIVLESIGFIAISAFAAFSDPLEKVRRNAKHRLATETDLQSSGFRNELVECVMAGPNRELRERFHRDLDAKLGALDVARQVLADGFRSIEQLHDALASASHE